MTLTPSATWITCAAPPGLARSAPRCPIRSPSADTTSASSSVRQARRRGPSDRPARTTERYMMRIQGFDHVEYYVGDLEQSAERLCNAFGFRVHKVAYVVLDMVESL